MSGRAFDKAVRRKPLAFAADAVGVYRNGMWATSEIGVRPRTTNSWRSFRRVHFTPHGLQNCIARENAEAVFHDLLRLGTISN